MLQLPEIGIELALADIYLDAPLPAPAAESEAEAS